MIVSDQTKISHTLVLKNKGGKYGNKTIQLNGIE